MVNPTTASTIMELNKRHNNNSPSTTTNTTSSTSSLSTPQQLQMADSANADPMQSWWESVSRARSRILSLSDLLPPSSFSISSLADSDRPALSFLASRDAYSLLSSALSAPGSGSGSDLLCQWLYETYLSPDPHLRLVVLSFVPLLSGIYLGRLHSFDSASAPPLAGFEAVLLAIYTAEAKSRAGKPLLVHVPDLSQLSLYHSPRIKRPEAAAPPASVGILCAPLEPQISVKSTKRPVIIGVALDCYFKQIAQMPGWSKAELCRFAADWAGQDCSCKHRLDGNDSDHGPRFFLEGHDVGDRDEIEGMEEEAARKLKLEGEGEDEEEVSQPRGVRIPLPWEVLQPLLRIIGHCLLAPLNPQDVKDAASRAVRRLYARASHDLVPQAILATRSLIQLDKRAHEAAKEVAAAANSSSNANTPSKVKKPEILLVSK